MYCYGSLTLTASILNRVKSEQSQSTSGGPSWAWACWTNWVSSTAPWCGRAQCCCLYAHPTGHFILLLWSLFKPWFDCQQSPIMHLPLHLTVCLQDVNLARLTCRNWCPKRRSQVAAVQWPQALAQEKMVISCFILLPWKNSVFALKVVGILFAIRLWSSSSGVFSWWTFGGHGFGWGQLGSNGDRRTCHDWPKGQI